VPGTAISEGLARIRKRHATKRCIGHRCRHRFRLYNLLHCINTHKLPTNLKEAFETEGYVVVRSLFSAEEAAHLRNHYTTLRESGNVPGDPFRYPDPGVAVDPLQRYPRMLQMHRWDADSLNWLLDPRINRVLTALLGREPFAVQSMIYFKPPGARGQALHQDNYYLRAKPGTCCAAWMALETCDETNGCLQVAPGSQTWPVLCTVPADTQQSFTDVMTPVPADTNIVPVCMQAGDVLFFNGQLVHGSLPNSTADRFRRSLIGHYIEGEAQQVASWFKPALRMDGSEVILDTSENGTRCGLWVDVHGNPVIEETGFEVVDRATE
jgi:phytanoyl-CoA hydroxylase